MVTAAVQDASDLDWLLIAAAEAQVRGASLRLLSVSNVPAYMGAGHRVIGSGSALGRMPHALLHHGRCPVQIIPPGYVTAADGGS
ncbi:hypothetical protein [Streptomyces sp. bgisy029]|uniref:hypothetical protein n=1 Tax=Streptomyces sp. bgisy029 TaxID=3413771 RepID=UPI003D74D89E